MARVIEESGQLHQSGAATGHLPAYIAITTSVVLWGLAPVATRYLVLQADPLGVLGIRFALCSLCYLLMLPRLRLASVRWSRRYLVGVLGCGLVGIIGYNVPVTLGIQYVPAGLAGILLATEPIWIALLSTVFLRQKLTPTLLWGLGVAFAGVVTLSVGEGLEVGSSVFAGSALVLLGTFMWGVYSISVGPLARRFGTLRISALTLWAGTIPLVVLSSGAMVAVAPTLTATSWVVLLLYGLGPNVIGMLLWNYGLSKVPGTQAGLFLYLYPVVSIAGGAILLGEHVTAEMLVGGVLIVGGLVLAQYNAMSQIFSGRSAAPLAAVRRLVRRSRVAAGCWRRRTPS